MTVEYAAKVATARFGILVKLLFRWRGSIYKLVWKDFVVYACIYYTLSFTYLFALNETGKRYFESISLYCEKFNDLIPIAFILGFYVSLVVSRFWEQLGCLPWPSRLSVFVSTLIHGRDDRSRQMRRTIVRYLSLSYVLTMRRFCKPVERRFETYDAITEAGFMTSDEQKSIEILESSRSEKPSIYYVPLVWAACLVTYARKEGRIKDDFAVKTLIDEINDFRGKCGALAFFDRISVPLVYTQVVTIAVYTFFLSCLMGRQYLEKTSGSHDTEMYFPLFTFLQFIFYMGWLEVAVMLINPFGEDDDDFDINGFIDGNLESSYIIVDHMFDTVPELVQDKYWSQIHISVPYSKGSEQYHKSERADNAGSFTANSFISKFSNQNTSGRFSSRVGITMILLQLIAFLSSSLILGRFHELERVAPKLVMLQDLQNKEKDKTGFVQIDESFEPVELEEKIEGSVEDFKETESNDINPASWPRNDQEIEEETQFWMSDIDINREHQSLLDKTSDAKWKGRVVSDLAPLATPEFDDIDNRWRFGLQKVRRYESSSFSQNFVDDIRDQLKSLRQGSTVVTPRQ